MPTPDAGKKNLTANSFLSLMITLLWIYSERSTIISYHQLGEHDIQLIASGHRQSRLHGLQGKVLPQPVGDLWVIVAIEAAEEEGEATAAAALPRGHGCPTCLASRVWRVGGSA